MEKSVIISIRGTQFAENGEEEIIEFVTDGRLSQSEGDGYCISYEESELTGMEGTTTTFQIEDNRITLHRSGSSNSQMIFEEGKRHLSFYETPYGEVIIGVNTHRAWSDFGQDGGSLGIQYGVEVDNALMGENQVLIHVRNPVNHAGEL